MKMKKRSQKPEDFSSAIQQSLDSFIEIEAFLDLMLVKKEFKISSVEVMKNKVIKGGSMLLEVQSKLGRVLQEAAIANINEDIYSICKNIEKITTEVPQEVKKQLTLLNEEIHSLSLCLKSIPEQLDLDFSRKINRILDVAANIENHTKKYQKTFVADLERTLQTYVDKIKML
ncbi:hypothetical protein CJF42_25970 [Pseudoalteromonas sp. NBT06-2]|uniref:hypothetical protein n=1 Tax=Pseudoalteromonas sp. NBT06-2 TaxID=2025950 RepID=UPI000BA4E7D7|nr:hypothetical protein [Pseudoalteromonas sp. NBT06-2]PAJ70795.1 hypothetical protein CJF42_25970 [Pseudoalteromonas sp. NBT06-2]